MGIYCQRYELLIRAETVAVLCLRCALQMRFVEMLHSDWLEVLFFILPCFYSALFLLQNIKAEHCTPERTKDVHVHSEREFNCILI